MSAIWDTTTLTRYKDDLPIAHYHPSLPNMQDDNQIKTAMYAELGQLVDKSDAFLAADIHYKSLQFGDDSLNSSKYDESWAASERPSTFSLLDAEETEPSRAKRNDRVQASSPILHEMAPPVQTQSSSQKNDDSSCEAANHSSVLSKYITRFRSGPALSRERRQQTWRASPTDFWWLANEQAASGRPSNETAASGRRGGANEGCDLGISSRSDTKNYSDLHPHTENNIDLESWTLQEKADKLLEKTASSLTSCDAAISSEGLGSAASLGDGSTARTLSWQQEAPPSSRHRPHATRLGNHVARSRLPEDDILKQWRLRRRLDLARDCVERPRPPAVNQRLDSAHIPARPALQQSCAAAVDRAPSWVIAGGTETIRSVCSGHTADRSAAWSPHVGPTQSPDVAPTRGPVGSQTTANPPLPCTAHIQQAQQVDECSQTPAVPLTADGAAPLEADVTLRSGQQDSCTQTRRAEAAGGTRRLVAERDVQVDSAHRAPLPAGTARSKEYDASRREGGSKTGRRHGNRSRTDRVARQHGDGVRSRPDGGREDRGAKTDGVGRENGTVGRENDTVGRKNDAVGRENGAIGRENDAVGRENDAVSTTDGSRVFSARDGDRVRRRRSPAERGASRAAEDGKMADVARVGSVSGGSTQPAASGGRHVTAPVCHSSPKQAVRTAIGQVVGDCLFQSSSSWVSSSIESTCQEKQVDHKPTAIDVQGLIDMDDENEFSADDILVNLRAKRAAYVNKLSIIDARLDCGI